MRACADLRVLFRAPAGTRRGFGHLVRCRSLARALGVRPLIALRGTPSATDTALALGCDVVPATSPRLLRALRPDVLVVDDPVNTDAQRWIDAARKIGCLVVTVHDLGLGCAKGDIVVDGSVMPLDAKLPGQLLAGPRFAILDPAVSTACETVVERKSSLPRVRTTFPHRVVVSLGGGPRTALAKRIANAIAAAEPDAVVRVVGGFTTRRAGRAGKSVGRVTWVGPQDGLVRELRRSDVAVVGGGVSLYEACALGVAAVGVPVVAAQRPTVAAFVERNAACGRAHGSPSAEGIAAEVVRLLRDRRLRQRIARSGRRLVDGLGAFRAAAAIAQVLRQP